MACRFCAHTRDGWIKVECPGLPLNGAQVPREVDGRPVVFCSKSIHHPRHRHLDKCPCRSAAATATTDHNAESIIASLRTLTNQSASIMLISCITHASSSTERASWLEMAE